MNQNIFISTTFIKDQMPLKRALDQINKSKIDCVEIGSNHCYEENYDYVLEFPYEYIIHNYFPIPKKSFIVNIASLDENIRKQSVNHIKKAIDYCNKINAKLYTFHPGFISDPISSNQDSKNYDFKWNVIDQNKTNFNNAKNNMFISLDEITNYARHNNIPIAIETEGSFNKKEYLLMQKPEEYIELMSKYSSDDIGINLNIGHLNLAANAFNFDKLKFVDLIQNYLVAMELSHNNGIEDQHLPLEKNNWYWDLINDMRFKSLFKILEFRNTSIDDIINNIKLFR